MKTLVAVLLLALCGCSVIRIKDSQRGVSTTAYMPAYPWQDSSRTIERLSVLARTNGTTISMRGLTDTETTSTNATAMIADVVGAAVTAAIRATIKP